MGVKTNTIFFLPLPQDPDWQWLLRAVYESINNENILMDNNEPFIVNITSVYEDHLKRIINKTDTKIHTWFENAKRDSEEVAKKTLHADLTSTTRNLKTLAHNPRYLQQIKKEGSVSV